MQMKVVLFSAWAHCCCSTKIVDANMICVCVWTKEADKGVVTGCDSTLQRRTGSYYLAAHRWGREDIYIYPRFSGTCQCYRGTSATTTAACRQQCFAYKQPTHTHIWHFGPEASTLIVKFICTIEWSGGIEQKRQFHTFHHWARPRDSECGTGVAVAVPSSFANFRWQTKRAMRNSSCQCRRQMRC